VGTKRGVLVHEPYPTAIPSLFIIHLAVLSSNLTFNYRPLNPFTSVDFPEPVVP